MYPVLYFLIQYAVRSKLEEKLENVNGDYTDSFL